MALTAIEEIAINIPATATPPAISLHALKKKMQRAPEEINIWKLTGMSDRFIAGFTLTPYEREVAETRIRMLQLPETIDSLAYFERHAMYKTLSAEQTHPNNRYRDTYLRLQEKYKTPPTRDQIFSIEYFQAGWVWDGLYRDRTVRKTWWQRHRRGITFLATVATLGAGATILAPAAAVTAAAPTVVTGTGILAGIKTTAGAVYAKVAAGATTVITAGKKAYEKLTPAGELLATAQETVQSLTGEAGIETTPTGGRRVSAPDSSVVMYIGIGIGFLFLLIWAIRK